MGVLADHSSDVPDTGTLKCSSPSIIFRNSVTSSNTLPGPLPAVTRARTHARTHALPVPLLSVKSGQVRVAIACCVYQQKVTHSETRKGKGDTATGNAKTKSHRFRTSYLQRDPGQRRNLRQKSSDIILLGRRYEIETIATSLVQLEGEHGNTDTFAYGKVCLYIVHPQLYVAVVAEQQKSDTIASHFFRGGRHLRTTLLPRELDDGVTTIYVASLLNNKKRSLFRCHKASHN